MNLKKEINALLIEESDICWKSFWDELNSDENRDYRRGFKAGILCATLRFKANLGDIEEVDGLINP